MLKNKRGDSMFSKSKLFIGFTIAIILMFSLLSYYIFNETSKTVIEKERKELEIIGQSIDMKMKQQLEFVEIGVLTLAHNTEVQKNFAERNRDKLVEMLLPVYESMSEEIAQIQFHLPDSTSFLRLHRLDEYGDNLRDFRFTVNDANKKKQIIRGLEEGVAGYGLRVVAPMFYEGVHIGSVEYGHNFGDSFLIALKENYSGEYFAHCLRDHEIHEINLGIVGATSSKDKWELEVQPYIDDLENGKTLYLTTDDKMYNIMLKPFSDYNGDIAGYFKIINDRADTVRKINSIKMNAIIFTTILIGLVLVLFYKF